MSYFKNFPLINVPGAGVAKNIVARPKLNVVGVTTDLVLNESLRPDQIASRIYQDEGLDWLVYMANNVIDPYYQVFLDDDAFNNVIRKKYGSREAASQRIVLWRTNWRDDIAAISPQTYDSLPADVRGYYHANTKGTQTVWEYVRKKETIYKTTNIIARYQLNAPLTVAVGEVVTLGSYQGLATVVSIDSQYLTVQHVFSTYSVDVINEVSVTLIMTIKTISDTEAPYYQAVSAYEAEQTANEARRNIKLVPSGQAQMLKKDLTRIFN